MTRKRMGSRRARVLGAGLLVMVLLAVGGEIALRMGPSSSRAQKLIREEESLGGPQYVPDPDLGTRLKPFTYEIAPGLDYVDTLQTDHLGFPNHEPWPDRIDVAVLGNSLLAGSGVGLDGTIPSRLQDRLPGRRVLNLGLVGGGIVREHTIWKKYAEPLHPRLVIATVWVTWDFENTRKFTRWIAEGRPDSSYTHYRMTYNQTHRKAGPRHKPSRLTRLQRRVKAELGRSYLVSALYRRAKSLLGGSLMRQVVVLQGGDTLFLSVRDQQRLALGIDRADTPNLRDLVFGSLDQMKREVEADGGRLLVVLVPSKEEIYGADSYPPVRRPIRETRAEVEARGLPVLDLYPLFEEQGRDRAPFFRTDMHLNAYGTQIAVNAITDWISRNHIFDATSDPGSSSAKSVVNR